MQSENMLIQFRFANFLFHSILLTVLISLTMVLSSGCENEIITSVPKILDSIKTSVNFIQTVLSL